MDYMAIMTEEKIKDIESTMRVCGLNLKDAIKLAKSESVAGPKVLERVAAYFQNNEN